MDRNIVFFKDAVLGRALTDTADCLIEDGLFLIRPYFIFSGADEVDIADMVGVIIVKADAASAAGTFVFL